MLIQVSEWEIFIVNCIDLRHNLEWSNSFNKWTKAWVFWM